MTMTQSITKGSQTTSRRGEIKYVLDDEQYHQLVSLIAPYVQPDTYPHSLITSTYFDTEDNRILRRSLEKPLYKEKIRVRSYGAHQKLDHYCFLEFKKKLRGTVYKRRVSMTFNEAYCYLGSGVRPYESLTYLNNDQRAVALGVLDEFDQALKRYGMLAPSLAVSYHRISIREINTDSLRITFDRDIKWGLCPGQLALASPSHPLLENASCILEIKATTAVPLWLVEILDSLKIYPRSFSKIGKSYLAWLQMAGQLNDSETGMERHGPCQSIWKCA